MRRGGRLRKGREIQRVFDEGASLRGSRFLLRWAGNDLRTVRWCFAVGKKLAPKAVERNTVRRRMRAAVDAGVAEPSVGIDVVVIAGRGSLEASVAELNQELENLMRRIAVGGRP